MNHKSLSPSKSAWLRFRIFSQIFSLHKICPCPFDILYNCNFKSNNATGLPGPTMMLNPGMEH